MRLSAQDRHDIDDVIQRYGTCFDLRDREGVLACFTDDVHLDYLDGLKIVDGAEQVAREMFHFGSVPLPGVDRILHSDHAMRLCSLAEADDGEVASVTLCVAHLVVEGAGETRLLTRGIRYDDVHRKTSAGWRISSRRHSQLWESAAAARAF